MQTCSAIHELGHITLGLAKGDVRLYRVLDGWLVDSQLPDHEIEAVDGMCAGIIAEHLHRLGNTDKVLSYLRAVSVEEFLATPTGEHDAQLLVELPKAQLADCIARIGPALQLAFARIPACMLIQLEREMHGMRVGAVKLFTRTRH